MHYMTDNLLVNEINELYDIQYKMCLQFSYTYIPAKTDHEYP